MRPSSQRNAWFSPKAVCALRPRTWPRVVDGERPGLEGPPSVPRSMIESCLDCGCATTTAVTTIIEMATRLSRRDGVDELRTTVKLLS